MVNPRAATLKKTVKKKWLNATLKTHIKNKSKMADVNPTVSITLMANGLNNSIKRQKL